MLGAFLAAGYGFQTAGLERTTVSSTGFITGLYVVLTPLFGLVLFRQATRAAVWVGVGLAVVGFALLSGIEVGEPLGDLLVLVSAVATAFQIILVERYAARYDALALTMVEMVTAFVGFAAIAVALGQLEVPHGWTVWGALFVTGVFASALGYLVQIWAQRRISAGRTAPVFSLEVVWTGLFGYVLADDRLGSAGWTGCALILAGILVSEPASAIRTLAGRT